LPNEPRWLPIDAVIEKNRLEVEETGERHLLRDIALLEAHWHGPKMHSLMAKKTSLRSPSGFWPR
jgi:hypothetical protein